MSKIQEYRPKIVDLREVALIPVIFLDGPFREALDAKSLLGVSRSGGLAVSLTNKCSLRIPSETQRDRRGKSVC